MRKAILRKMISNTNTKNSEELRLNLYSLYSDFLLSKEAFRNNKDLKPFLEKNKIYFKDYVYARRTTVISRFVRKIEKGNTEELILYFNSIKKELFEELSLPKKKNNLNSDLDEILNQFGD
ncbi:hypothetical protein DOS67_09835 [Staphylococcus felis]|uniref:hypothetical protein n=1 Tax=Staphylococcus felis TaxID=46127 RepID=UPI000E27C7E8|nr:hypothetical protein [Staphylococcus felis]REH94085.1 hypothetical protein DOS67_09835 [Staphylococcus felis]